MSLFNQNLTYVTDPSLEEREKIARIVLGPQTTKLLKISNWIVNIIIPIIVCYFTNCNLITVAISFVLTDILLCAIGDHMIIHKPHQEISENLLSCTRRDLEMTKEKRDNLRDKMDAFKRVNCTSKCQMDCDRCAAEDMKDELEALNTYIEFERDWVEMKLAPMKEAEMAAVVAMEQKPTKELTEKIEYFTIFAEKIDYFVANHDFTFLRPVKDSVNRLITILKTKPDGYSLIPRTLYLYIDELQKVLGKLTGLQESQMDDYMEDLVKVSEALSKNVNDVIAKIEQIDAADIEVTLSVLINELTKEDEGII